MALACGIGTGTWALALGLPCSRNSDKSESPKTFMKCGDATGFKTCNTWHWHWQWRCLWHSILPMPMPSGNIIGIGTGTGPDIGTDIRSGIGLH